MQATTRAASAREQSSPGLSGHPQCGPGGETSLANSLAPLGQAYHCPKPYTGPLLTA